MTINTTMYKIFMAESLSAHKWFNMTNPYFT